jgi:hypothetical protein
MVGSAQELAPPSSGDGTRAGDGDGDGTRASDGTGTDRPNGDASAGTTPLDPHHRLYQPVSARGPAFIVLGIAVFIVVVGTVASALVSGSTPTTTVGSVTIPGGIGVRLTPATTAMKSIASEGQPPADILRNMAVPAGSAVVRSLDADQGAAQFDRTVYFTTGLSTNELVDVYRTLLPKLGWQIIYKGDGAERAANQTEVLAKRGSGDGFYWEVGVVVSPVTSAGITPYSVELFELPDDN